MVFNFCLPKERRDWHSQIRRLELHGRMIFVVAALALSFSHDDTVAVRCRKRLFPHSYWRRVTKGVFTTWVASSACRNLWTLVALESYILARKCLSVYWYDTLCCLRYYLLVFLQRHSIKRWLQLMKVIQACPPNKSCLTWFQGSRNSQTNLS